MSGIHESQKSESAQSASRLTSTNRERLTQERVKELFDYRDGELIWNIRGGVAGYSNGNGYLRIEVDGKKHYVHRVIWLWNNGYLPEKGIDHINRNRADNRIENLREVGQTCNIRNTDNRKTNTSGVKGVYWGAENGKWRAQIMVAGKVHCLGSHIDFFEAVCHRLAAEQLLGWEGCDSSSPALKFIQANLQDGIK